MRKGLVFALIFVVIVLSGCGTFSRDKAATTVDTEYHKGTQGLEMAFVKNTPPNLVYYTGLGARDRGGDFIVMVELRNKGAYDINDGRLYLSGFDKSIIRGLDQGLLGWTSFRIDGKSRFNAEGGFQVKTLPDDSSYGKIALPEGVDTIQQNIIVNSCYQYKTDAAPVVCIDPDPYREIGEKACRSTDAVAGLAGGQGAPVVVTNVEEEMTPGKVFFKIHVSNSGRGIVIDKGRIGDCPFDVKYKDLGNINYVVTANTYGRGAEQGNCEPTTLKLIDEKGVIYCNFPATVAGSAYRTPLNIELSYAYMDSVSKQIEIRSTASTR